MKRLLSLILALVLVLGVMTGCGGNKDPKTPEPTKETVVLDDTNKPADEKDKAADEKDNTIVQTNPNLVTGDNLEWPQDKMGTIENPFKNSKLVSINADAASCTVGFENVEAKDAEAFLTSLKESGRMIVFESNKDGIILFACSGDDGTVTYTYNYADKTAIMALSYPVA